MLFESRCLVRTVCQKSTRFYTVGRQWIRLVFVISLSSETSRRTGGKVILDAKGRWAPEVSLFRGKEKPGKREFHLSDVSCVWATPFKNRGLLGAPTAGISAETTIPSHAEHH